MADFGKLNFAVSFNPQTAFPLDARYYFSSLSAAEAAAATAVEVGSSDGTYFYGENVCVVTESSADLYIIQPDKTLKAVGSAVLGDGKSIEIVDGKVALKGFGSATAGQQPRINAAGTAIEWYTPDTSTVSGLADTVAGHTQDIQNLQTGKADKATTLEGYGIKCQLSIKCAGHYMDDYYVIVPPDRDAKEIMALIVAKAESLKLTVSKSKSRIVPLTKPFRYCKAKFILTETGRVVMNGNRDGVKRARRKIKAFRTKIQNGEMSYDDLWTSVNGMLAYFESYDDHNRVLRLRRLFYSVFGFSPERIENFRERGKKDEICCA